VLHNRQNDGMISVDHEDLQFSNHVQMHRQFLDVLRGWLDGGIYIDGGTDFDLQPPLGPVRASYMKRWLGALRRLPKRSLTRRVLRNVLIPDFLIYFLQSRSAPYRLRRTFHSYTSYESHIRP
jgi:hypothetical protein